MYLINNLTFSFKFKSNLWMNRMLEKDYNYKYNY